GVIGHEVSHVANGDMVTMTLIQGVMNAFVMFLSRVIAIALARGSRENRAPSYMIVFMLEMVLGFFGMLVVAWFSRQREYRADAGGAAVAGRGKMIAALQALNRMHGRGAPAQDGQASLATLKISGPRNFLALWSTHPP